MGALGRLLFCASLLLPLATHAELATIYGSLGNFDVVNNTGHGAHGFECEMEGASVGDVYSTFTSQRYGGHQIAPTATGVRVRWVSPTDANGNYTQTTVAHPGGPWNSTCYMWLPTYAGSGCEHFGIHSRSYSLKTSCRWLKRNAQGGLDPVDPPMAIAAPYYAVRPPVVAGDPPEIEIEFDAPEPAEAPELHGDAQWTRIFVREVSREVELDELLTGADVVPQDEDELEADWDLIQDEPGSGNDGDREHVNGRARFAPTTRAVVRRIELYEYTGAYDPVTHEALCEDPLCAEPAEGELGDLISAQMTAVHVEPEAVVVTGSGGGRGRVTDPSGAIDCGAGNVCGAFYEPGSAVALTAAADPGSRFTGWSGGCTGVASTCNVTVDGRVDVTASFARSLGSSGSSSCGIGGELALALPLVGWLRRRTRRGVGA